MKAIDHELVRPLEKYELWMGTNAGPEDLARTPCAATVRGRPCKNHATHRTEGEGSRLAYVNLCLTHAILHVEANSDDLVHEGMIYEIRRP